MSMALAPRLSSTGELSRAMIPATLGHLMTPFPTLIPIPNPYPDPDPVSTSASTSTSVSRIRRTRAEPVGAAAAAGALRRGCRPRVDIAPPCGARCGARCNAWRNARRHAIIARCGARPSQQRRSSLPQLPGVEKIQARGCDTRGEHSCRADPLQGWAVACALAKAAPVSKHRRKFNADPNFSTGFPTPRHARGGCAAAADGGQADGEQHGVDLRRARPAGGTDAQAIRPLFAAAAGHCGTGRRRRERAPPQPGTTRRRTVRRQRAGGDPDAAVN